MLECKKNRLVCSCGSNCYENLRRKIKPAPEKAQTLTFINDKTCTQSILPTQSYIPEAANRRREEAMMPEKTQFDGFNASATRAAKTIRETVENDGFIQVFSHLDADGIAAAGILGKALWRLNARFRIRVTQWVDEKIIGEIATGKPQLVVLTDFGSGYIDLLNEKMRDQRIVILDHHQIVGNAANENVVHVNPHLHGIDGATDVSGSGVTYFVAKALDPMNVDLSPIAIVGALGDMQDKYEQRHLGGLNTLIVEDAVNAGLVKVDKDLTFFGRETRPIHKALASSTSPFIPGISGDDGAAVAFLSNLGIPLKDGDKFRALRDLSEDEKKRLSTVLAEHLLSKGLHLEVPKLIGDVYVLTSEQPWTSLRDAREFSVVLNSTGRLDKPSLGIAVCMGDRKAALTEANKVLEDYRKDINRYLNWVTEKPERMREFEHVYVVYGEDAVNEKIIGTVASILAYSLPVSEKPILGFANVQPEGVAKFSARTTDATVEKGVNLGEVLRMASEKFGGKGGGHNIAAGAQVPLDKMEDFIRLADELVGKQLRGEKVGSDVSTGVR
jgi:single-stranded-DNA-specific exonuclease